MIDACSSQAGLASTGRSGNGAEQAAINGSNGVGAIPEELLYTIIETVIEGEGIYRGRISVDRAESVIWPHGSPG